MNHVALTIPHGAHHEAIHLIDFAGNTRLHWHALRIPHRAFLNVPHDGDKIRPA
jgi:hypothetical protein